MCNWLHAKLSDSCGRIRYLATSALPAVGDGTTHDPLVAEHVNVSASIMPSPMRGPPMEIRLKPGTVPTACLVLRKVPFELRIEEATKTELANNSLIRKVIGPTA